MAEVAVDGRSITQSPVSLKGGVKVKLQYRGNCQRKGEVSANGELKI